MLCSQARQLCCYSVALCDAEIQVWVFRSRSRLFEVCLVGHSLRQHGLAINGFDLLATTLFIRVFIKNPAICKLFLAAGMGNCCACIEQGQVGFVEQVGDNCSLLDSAA